jgi:hypothetical protein
MARKDYIPSKDGEFLTWEQTFINYASANLAALNLVAADLAPVTSAQGDFETDYLALLPAQAAAKAAKAARDDSRKAFVDLIRKLVKRIQANTNVTDEQRENLGSPCASRRRRRSRSTPSR